MRKNDTSLEKIGEILEKSLKRLDQSGRLVEYGVWPIWNDIVGSTIAHNAQPEKIRHGTLFVKVTGPTWMQQLQYMKEMIADKLNERLGSEVVKNIFFFVGQLKTEVPVASKEKVSVSTPFPAESNFNENEEELQTLKDPEIRRAFKRLLAARSRKTKS